MPKKKFGNALDKKIKTTPLKVSTSLVEDIDKVRVENQKASNNNTLTIATEQINKLELLLEHFDIKKDDPQRWFLLSVFLANQYVEGFKVDNTEIKRKPQEWDGWKYFRLYIDVQRKKSANPTLSYDCICSILEAKDEYWKGKTSLSKRYSEAKGSILLKVINNMPGDHTNFLTSDEFYCDLKNLTESK